MVAAKGRMRNGMRWIGSLMVLIASLAGVACRDDSPKSEWTNKPPQWVHQANPHNKIAVVFIHGIFGDTLDTWKSASGTRFFDLLHQAPGIGDKVDVFAFGFQSTMFTGGSLSIDEAARSFHQYMQHNELWDYDQVVIVAHSMGGLIAMQELTSHAKLAEKVPLMVFYATPQEGSQITAIAEHVVNNDAIRQMLLVDNNDFLRELNNEWTELRGSGNAPRVICAYEKKPTKGVMIVPWSSATRICDEAAPAIGGSDHLSIVKPDSSDDLAVVVLLNALKTYVMPRLDATAWQLSNVEPQGDSWLFRLTDVNNFNLARLTNRSSLKQSYRIIRPDNSTLFISPESDFRTVAAGASDEIKMLPIGDLKSEYSFELKLASTPIRKVLVKIPDLDAALAQRAERSTQLVAGINAFLESQPDPVAFNALPEQERNQKMADVAFQFASDQNPGAPENVKWVVAADALSRVGLPSTATAALQKAEKDSPQLARSATVRNLASIIAGQSGKEDVLTTLPTPGPQATVQPEATIELQHATAVDRREWRQLAERLETVPGMESEALSIKGDVQVASGNEAAATELYQRAAVLQPSPVVNAKLQRLGARAGGATP